MKQKSSEKLLLCIEEKRVLGLPLVDRIEKMRELLWLLSWPWGIKLEPTGGEEGLDQY